MLKWYSTQHVGFWCFESAMSSTSFGNIPDFTIWFRMSVSNDRFNKSLTQALVRSAVPVELLEVAPDALSPMPFKVVAKRSNRKLNKFTMT